MTEDSARILPAPLTLETPAPVPALGPVLLAAAIAAVAFTLSELLLPASIAAPARRCIGVFAATAAFWAWGRPDPAVTALLALVLLPATGALPSARVFAAFGSETVFFALGALLLAAALQATGLSTRLSAWALARAGGSPARIRTALYLLSGGLALVMNEHAVAAMLLPLAFQLADALPERGRRGGFSASLCLAVAWGSTAGGIGTMLGGTRAPLALGVLEQAGAPRFGFAGYSLAALPVSATLFSLGLLLLRVLYPAPALLVPPVAAADRPLCAREKVAGATLALAVIAWAALGDRLGLATIGLAAAVVLVASGTVSWQDLERRVHWGALVLIGCAVALGSALAQSGAAEVLARRLAGFPPALLPGALVAATVLLTSLMSHAATVATLLPLGLTLAVPGQAREVALIVAVASGLGFALPASSVANVLALSSGRLSPRQILVGGAAMAAAGTLLVLACSRWLWPALGF